MAFKGKHAIVTGGANGIGLQVVKQLLMHDVHKVAIIDLQDNLEEIVILRAAFPAQHLLLIKMDVANAKGIEATYEEILKTFGHLDIVVNVAGLFNDQDVQRTLMVNLGGMINSTLNAMKAMSKEKGGKGGIICNMASVVGLDPMFLVPIYAATKAGIINFTRCLGKEIYYQRHGVKFITVCPEMSDESYLVLDRLNKQSAADVSRCILSALEKQENGAVYIIEGKRLFPIDMKRYWTGIEKELNE
ncbi:alcohol dehydrogenase 1 isoform X2 [Lucilia cuprina]|uniref:alcohol dehydrogenase 1 isoform X2 n=1 Tax=Lucilia cuprina TaxID=7375 RepID=UPI000C71ADDE|nr:alcohol dehydrogenase 1 isoform X2 [Lucilia cuprina]